MSDVASWPKDTWGGTMRPVWDRENLIWMTEQGDTEGWTCAEWEWAGDLMRGRKGQFLPNQDIVLQRISARSNLWLLMLTYS